MSLDLAGLAPKIAHLAERAAAAILDVYDSDFAVEHKDDRSPLTAADLASHHLIVEGLGALTPDLPVLSEESAGISWEARSRWSRYWLVDPLDGTREFVKRNGEFTVNIALIEDHVPILSVVQQPVGGELAAAWRGGGAWLGKPGEKAQRVKTRKRASPLVVAGSRSHASERETELLARTALSRLPARADEDRPLSVVDVCTGSGNVALAMAAADSRIRVLGIDISEEAIELADANARHLDLAGRARFLVRDLFAGLDEQVDRHSLDLITCNPPYITSANLAHLPSETRDHEPRLAFDGGAFGLDVISRVVAESPHWLRPGAALCFEVGAANGKFFAGRVGRNDRYESVEPIANEEGVVRVIVATTRA